MGALRAEGRGQLALTTTDLRCCLAPPFFLMAGRRDSSCSPAPMVPRAVVAASAGVLALQGDLPGQIY